MYCLLRLWPLVAIATALVPAPSSGVRELRDVALYDLYQRAVANHTEFERGLGTSADVYIFNDWPTGMTFTSSNSEYMSTEPPATLVLSPYSVSNKYTIDANGWIPLQSKFQITLNPGTPSNINVDIGVLPFKTDYAPDINNPASQAGVMLAPFNILGKGSDFSFFFFSGPGILGPLLNSALDANIGAFIANIRKTPLKFSVSSDVDITINDIVNPDIKCSYASIVPGSTDGLITVNAIVDITVELQTTARFKKLTQNANVQFTGLSVLVTAQVDLGGLITSGSTAASNIGVTFTRFQTSLDSLTVDGDILTDIVAFLYPVLAPFLKLPYKLMSVINTSQNGPILTGLNNLVQSLGVKQVVTSKRWINARSLSSIWEKIKSVFDPPPTLQATGTPAPPPPIATPVPPAPTNTPAPTEAPWMSTLAIQGMKLSDLYIPGTHDSQAYAFQHILSLIQYPDIAFLWTFDYTLPAPSDGSFDPISGRPIHLGPVLGDYVMNSIIHVSRAQSRDLTTQLNGGIRHFDLRVYYDPSDDTFYSQHGLRAVPKLVDLLTQVQNFIASNPTAQELIVLDISHTNFNQDFELDNGTTITSDQVHAKFQSTIGQLQQWIYMPPNARGTPNFDFQTLQNATLGSITQGGNKVLILTPDFALPDLSVNTDGWIVAPSDKPPAGFYELSTAAALTPGDIVGNVLKGLSGRLEPDLLGVKAQEANAQIESTLRSLEGKTGTRVQLVSVDWWEFGANGKSAADIIIGLNGV
ncbi:hypothetical protein TWF694_006683 [Orbilia ellipsospora]|uniref:PLC-like phosphodiesterase n=1 Tax=Orbilia ellipsospora TaxID=2528407 RepID=A0AAV9XME6_9PEZI